ncbi:DUF5067 domain-containing protein [Enterococcus sp. AZ072]|uniref:DUF5067 domain-containing protein n=1 Tax=unclassified Enterococcus TaxID=2608891 RepID=UPI003D2B61C2
MKKKRIKLSLLVAYAILLSACTPVSKMATLSTEGTDSEVLHYGSEDSIAFPSAEITFLESGKNSSDIFYCQIKWTNNTEKALSFNEMFPTFKAEQVKELNDPNALPLEMLVLARDRKKLDPGKSQNLTLKFQLKNQEDLVYLTFGTIDNFEKHYDIYL